MTLDRVIGVNDVTSCLTFGQGAPISESEAGGSCQEFYSQWPTLCAPVDCFFCGWAQSARQNLVWFDPSPELPTAARYELLMQMAT